MLRSTFILFYYAQISHWVLKLSSYFFIHIFKTWKRLGGRIFFQFFLNRIQYLKPAVQIVQFFLDFWLNQQFIYGAIFWDIVELIRDAIRIRYSIIASTFWIEQFQSLFQQLVLPSKFFIGLFEIIVLLVLVLQFRNLFKIFLGLILEIFKLCQKSCFLFINRVLLLHE